MNLFNATNFPVRAWICFLVLGGCIWRCGFLGLHFYSFFAYQKIEELSEFDPEGGFVRVQLQMV